MPPLACNLNAIPASLRPHYHDLVKRLRAGVRNRVEQSEGYGLTLDGGAISRREVGEWIGIERLCCPFLTFQLSASGTENDWLLTLNGPPGVKTILEAEFPVRRVA